MWFVVCNLLLTFQNIVFVIFMLNKCSDQQEQICGIGKVVEIDEFSGCIGNIIEANGRKGFEFLVILLKIRFSFLF